MTRRTALSLLTVSIAAVACGERGIGVPARDRPAAESFVLHCSGCHTLQVAGTEGSATDVRTREYKDGPNFDARKETRNCVLFAIRNGGFSSGPMPQNIVTGPAADQLADFLAKYSGTKRPPVSGPAPAVPDCPAG
jgi:hypothetical protein